MDMNSELLKKAAAIVLALALGVVAGRYTLPEKIVTKTETVVVEKEVIKTKEVVTKDTNKDREMIVTEVISPDGTRKITKHYINRDTIREDATRTNTTTNTSNTSSRTEITVDNGKADWNVSVLATTSHTDSDLLKGSMSYGVHVQRRIIGPFQLGAFGITNKTYGLSLGASF